MERAYDIFEKFSDGCSFWRDCVPGLFDALLRLEELGQRSENEFFAIDLYSHKRFPNVIRTADGPRQRDVVKDALRVLRILKADKLSFPDWE